MVLLARTTGQLEETRVLLHEQRVPAGRVSVRPADLAGADTGAVWDVSTTPAGA